jgi:hypothetical protein
VKRKKRPGRPKHEHPIKPELARKMIRRMPLGFALMILGSYATAEECMRRRKERCEETGQKYVYDDALAEAAKLVKMDPSTLDNWLRRPKHKRARY